ncbi:hypothetical protein OB919_17690 [Halobacteria archaeon AArc-curdl1]|uniref:DUF7344 domain-containing protein n=1 Tax=Natronosalvus hydrolyticus TaxID=2979988 RepID=A0AAP3E7E7_9EURY|nr:hypothetical protein [Halobacteria archaeon AArc-curdl1]
MKECDREGTSTQPISRQRLATLEREAPLDEISMALADARVRYTLHYVDEEGTATLEALTDFLTGIDASKSRSVHTSTDWEHIRTSLHHDVLPRLEALGFVVYEGATETVIATGWPEAVTRALQVADTPLFESGPE